MFLTTLIFLFQIGRYYFKLVPGQSWRDSARQFIRSQRYFFEHISQRELLRLYVDYYRPSFHPWDLDNRTQLEAWRAELELANRATLAASSTAL